MVDHGTRAAIYRVAYESCFTMVFFYDHGPRLTMVPRVAIYHGMKQLVDHGLYMVISWSTMFLKHGRPCLKHGQPCFDRIHFTGVTL